MADIKRFVLQMQTFSYSPWNVVREFDTLEEAKAAFQALPIKTGYRVAEAYIQVRYKAVKDF